MLSRLRYRPLQALVLVGLAALVTVVACLGPLYQRDTEQALTRDTLQRATPQQASISLFAQGPRAFTASDLRARLPASLRSVAPTEVSTTAVAVLEQAPTRVTPVGRLVSSDDLCAHLVFSEGHCPTAPLEVAVSADDVHTYRFALGSTVLVHEFLDPGLEFPPVERSTSARLHVVGVYAAAPDDRYLAMPITGNAGQSDHGLISDDWVTVPQTLSGADAPRWRGPQYEVQWPVDADHADVDDLTTAGPVIEHFVAQQAASVFATSRYLRATSGLPQLVQEIRTGRDQGRTTVTALMLQLCVLALVVLWLVLGAAVEQRRPEVALALLRGRGSRGAGRLLVAELAPVALLGVLLGGVLSLAVSTALARVVLPVPVPFEVRPPFLLAWLGAAAAVVIAVLLAVRRAVREPVSALLRRVPARGSGRAGTAAETVVVAVCATAVVAFVTGNLRGPLAVVAPTLLAVAVGLVVARLLVPVSGRAAGRLLARGRVVTGLGLLQVARRPAVRRVLVLATVATALLVFCLDALTTGDHNRAYAAEQLNGAPEVLALDNDRVPAVLAALDRVDPDRHHLTVVVSIAPAGDPDRPTLGIEPAAFPRIAAFPGQDPGQVAWSDLAAPDVPPLTVTGTRLTGRLHLDDVDVSGAAADEGIADLGLRLDAVDGHTTTVDLGRVRAGTSTRPVAAALPCRKGCTVTGIGFSTTPAIDVAGSFRLTDLQADGSGPLVLGAAATWTAFESPEGGFLRPSDDAAGLGGDFDTRGSADPVMSQQWLPAVVPALVVGSDRGAFSAPGLDGVDQAMTVAGHLERVPGSPDGTRVVDVESLLRQGPTIDNNLQVAVWSDTPDPALLSSLTTALRAHGVRVAAATTIPEVRRQLDRSTPAWSLALGAVAGVVSLLVAVLVLLVVASITWRQRARDLAALRMSGVAGRDVRRIGVLEQLPTVVVGVLAGACSGVVGAHYALPSVPLFSTTPEVSTADFSTPWVAVTIVAGAGLLVLVVAGWTSGLWLAGRARLETVREVL